jgi:hypothetical protein
MASQSEVPGSTRCARCGHPWSFHQKQMKAQCRAMGCSVPVRGKPQRCPGFVKPKAAASTSAA